NLSDDEIFKINRNPPAFGISVLDENFDVIDEIILPDNIYSQHKYFVAEEGLYLSADHPENPNLKENEWRFDVFNLSKKSGIR
ncbi:MAG: hypothetical protein JXA03_06560, partial [Bacteroidales bacterium]|nr:hypothetical protein [Bacteroidales bacterium]